MALGSCCWYQDFSSTVRAPTSWLSNTHAWIDLAQSGATSAFFSGIPKYLKGSVAIDAWNKHASAVSQFVSGYFAYHHKGGAEAVHYGRANIRQRFGGLHPVIVLVVPDGYMRNYTPLWKNKFHWGLETDFSVTDLNTAIPAEVKTYQYYNQFIQAREQGFPNWSSDDMKPTSTSELDIDINLGFCHFENLERHGGTVSHIASFLASYGSGLSVDFSSYFPPRTDEDDGRLVFPIITVDYTTWIAGQASGEVDLICSYANSAGPAPTTEDDSIIAGLNRIYPLNQDNITLRSSVNGVVVEYETVQELFDQLKFLPVQEWSSPNDMQPSLTPDDAIPQVPSEPVPDDIVPITIEEEDIMGAFPTRPAIIYYTPKFSLSSSNRKALEFGLTHGHENMLTDTYQGFESFDDGGFLDVGVFGIDVPARGPADKADFAGFTLPINADARSMTAKPRGVTLQLAAYAADGSIKTFLPFLGNNAVQGLGQVDSSLGTGNAVDSINSTESVWVLQFHPAIHWLAKRWAVRDYFYDGKIMQTWFMVLYRRVVLDSSGRAERGYAHFNKDAATDAAWYPDAASSIQSQAGYSGAQLFDWTFTNVQTSQMFPSSAGI